MRCLTLGNVLKVEAGGQSVQLKVRIAGKRVRFVLREVSQTTISERDVVRQITYVFESVQILVSLATRLAVERLLFLHTKGSGIRRAGLGIDDRKSSVSILVQLLSLMAMCFVVPEGDNVLVLQTHETGRDDSLQTVLVLVGLLAPDDWALEWLVFLWHHHALEPFKQQLVGFWVIDLVLIQTKLLQLLQLLLK